MTKCPDCNDTGERDSGGTQPWGEPILLPCDCNDDEIGRQWRDNSSLEKWFPLAAERVAALATPNDALKRDLQYFMDWLTKGLTRMREDIERLTLELKEARDSAERQQLEDAARIQALAREAHAWRAAARDATEAERKRCATRVALHSQYPIENDYDRGYDKARKDAAETLRNMSTHVKTYEPDMDNLRKSVAEILGEPPTWPEHGNVPLAVAATVALLHSGCGRMQEKLERHKPLMQAVEWILDDGHMDQEHLARLRAAWEAT